MTCTICGQAEPQPGTGTMTLERADATFVMKGVPALVCPNCREEYEALRYPPECSSSPSRRFVGTTRISLVTSYTTPMALVHAGLMVIIVDNFLRGAARGSLP